MRDITPRDQRHRYGSESKSPERFTKSISNDEEVLISGTKKKVVLKEPFKASYYGS